LGRHLIGYRGEHCRVLITDDNVGNRTVLRDLLVPLGFEVLETVNGLEAVEATPTFIPHVILMDLVMPVMGGFEAAAAIRGLDLGYEPAIVAVSASVFDITKEQCQSSDCDDFLVKPINLDHLLDTVEKLTHITWTYEDENENDSEAKINSDSPLIPLPAVHLSRLHTLVMMGDVDALQSEASRIAEEAPEYVEFANAISTMAHDFKLDELQNLIEEHMEVES
jgi:CheY-like chemotaxis protein